MTGIREACGSGHYLADKVFNYIAKDRYVCPGMQDKVLKANPNSVRSIWVDPIEFEPPPSPTPLIFQPLFRLDAPVRRAFWRAVDSRRYGRP